MNTKFSDKYLLKRKDQLNFTFLKFSESKGFHFYNDLSFAI